MLKTIIMDFDGLIVDTEVVWYHIYVEWFRREKGYDLSVQEFLTCVGSNSEDLFRKLDDYAASDRAPELEPDAEEAPEQKSRRRRSRRLQAVPAGRKVPPRPGKGKSRRHRFHLPSDSPNGHSPPAPAGGL